MSRQEDFDKKSDEYVEERKSFGVNDPYALKEIGEAYYEGCEHGYQYAVEKACEWIKRNVLEFEHQSFVHEFDDCVEDFRKAMEE